MAEILNVPLVNGLQKTLDARLDAGTTASVTLNNTTNIQSPGVFVVNRIDANGNEKSASDREFIKFTGVSGNTLTGLTRNVDGGSSDQDHAVGSIVEFVADVIWAQALVDVIETEHNSDGTHGNVTTASLSTDTINEKTTNSGVTVDGVKHKDGQVYTDQINEKTDAAGVKVDGVLLKDNSVTASQQPSSLMYLSSNMSVSSGITNHTITFNSTAFNIGSGWNTTSNKYVAPQAGVYLVSLEVDVINGTVGYTFDLIIQKNSTSVYQKWCTVSSSGNHGDDISTIVSLAKDDEIKFVFYSPSTDSNRALAGGDTLQTVAYITKLH